MICPWECWAIKKSIFRWDVLSWLTLLRKHIWLMVCLILYTCVLWPHWEEWKTILHAGGTSSSSSRQTNAPRRSFQQHSAYQIPASALYDSSEDPGVYGSSGQAVPGGSNSKNCISWIVLGFYDSFNLFDL